MTGSCHLAAQLSPLSSQLASSLLQYTPPSALPGQPPNGRTPAYSTTNPSRRGLAKIAFCSPVHRSHYTVAEGLATPGPPSNDDEVSQITGQELAPQWGRGLAATTQEPTSYSLRKGIWTARDHPYSREPPIASKSGWRPYCMERLWLDTFPIQGQQEQRNISAQRAEGWGRAWGKTESHLVVFLYLKL